MNKKKFTSVFLLTALLLAAAIPAVTAHAERIAVSDYTEFFTPWQGTGDTSAVFGIVDYHKELISCFLPEEFASLKSGGRETVDPADYAVTQEDGKTKITLKESYLNTLEDGFYGYTAQFRDIDVDMRLAVVRQQRDRSDLSFAFDPYPGYGAATVMLHSEDGTRFDYNMLSSLRLGDRELTKDEYTVGQWGTAYISLNEAFLDTLPFGEYQFTADFLNAKNVTLVLWIDNPNKQGDVNGDCRVTSADARLALLFAARIRTGGSAEQLAADIDRSGSPDASDARQILRVAAKIDVLRVDVELFSHEGHPELDDYSYVIGALPAVATQYRWIVQAEPAEGLTITEQTLDRSEAGSIGLAASQRFLVSANKTGDYTVRLVQKNDWEDQWIDEIEFVFHVKDLGQHRTNTNARLA